VTETGRPQITSAPSFGALARSAESLRSASLSELFAADPTRVEAMTLTAAGITADLSKNLIDAEALAALVSLARQTGLEAFREAMLDGDPVNTSEGRAVLHTAMRASRSSSLVLDGRDVIADAVATLDAMGELTESVLRGSRVGATGERFRHVLAIGIGGSYLGPAMAVSALRRHATGSLDLRFATNIDGASFEAAICGLDPAATLVVISSKTFRTLETMANATKATIWLKGALGVEAVSVHLVAVTARPEAAEAFGVDPGSIFPIPESVGGRFSISSAIGLPVMLSIGVEGFAEFLEGFRAMDDHFASAPLEENLPVLMGLMRLWYSVFMRCETFAVVSYAADLGLFAPFLQQLEMESNGKSVDAQGEPMGVPTGPIVWGSTGTDAQHAFFQLLHQGTHLVPVDLIGVLRAMSDDLGAHDLLMANLFAQAEVLGFGVSAADLAAAGVPSNQAAHRVLPGNRPSTLLLLDELDPRTLGALVALYEHETAVQGAMLGIDSFDQWGVEAGKVIAERISAELGAPAGPSSHDLSTARALERYRSSRQI